ncbi:uncharacterized protein Z520_05876 [Fonsecaea multimorphosa CBS 102226]|uniref:Uncharacterized protein n=1 Tax=Fonsecaea multimorphosa CBS 102226 TaxID=1442371 RepID=A0A0D2H9M8_9EURO|nr:uncharacterized protein Z520_05876 [Fonsecaea multimorphosa CBS 102226]KIX98575.1 hypothetical protein Z520_05876 [Fonsecaea multimorphosa CBS 102226]OAL24767.1 hypothetical protein AYO22_05556 [Fonsecaea multimorphosa]
MQLPSLTAAVLALQALGVSAAALKARLTPQQNDCDLPEGDPQGADCNSTLRARQDGSIPLGLTSITVGTATTSSGTIVPISVPYSLSRDPIGPLIGSGTTIFDSSLKSATLVAGDVRSSSSASFSSAQCTFYTSGVDLGDGSAACDGDAVASASTDNGTKLTFDEAVMCMTCTYSS